MSENREYIARSEENGDVYISEEVLAMIAGATALEIEGVTGLAGGNLGEQLLNKKNLSRGVVVQREGDCLILNLSLFIQYGHAIPDVARKVQDAVANSVQDTSGLTVTAVNIRVGGISFPKSGPQA